MQDEPLDFEDDSARGSPQLPAGHNRSAAAAVTMAGNSLAQWGVKRYQRLRQRFPAVDWLIRFGMPALSAVFFLLDIISDVLLVASFWNVGEPKEFVFGVLSLLLILIPLIMTAVFVARSHIRAYVKRREAELVRAAAPGDALLGAAPSGAGLPGGDGGDAGAGAHVHCWSVLCLMCVLQDAAQCAAVRSWLWRWLGCAGFRRRQSCASQSSLYLCSQDCTRAWYAVWLSMCPRDQAGAC